MSNKQKEIQSIEADIDRLQQLCSSLIMEEKDLNLSRHFMSKSLSFANNHIDEEIERLQEKIEELNGKAKRSFTMNFTVALEEGMTITELYNDDSEKFVLVKSSVDGELYGVGSTTILKISETNEEDYICEDLDYFSKEKDYFEFENGRVLVDDTIEKRSKLVEMDELLWSELQEQIEDVAFHHWDNDFVDISVRKVSMTVEEFERKSNGSKIRYINFRDRVKEKFEELQKSVK